MDEHETGYKHNLENKEKQKLDGTGYNLENFSFSDHHVGLDSLGFSTETVQADVGLALGGAPRARRGITLSTDGMPAMAGPGRREVMARRRSD